MKDVGKGRRRKGPPPSVGWWPASIAKGSIGFVRWWDGEKWSIGAFSTMTPSLAAALAQKPSGRQEDIRWRDRADWWPLRSRT